MAPVRRRGTALRCWCWRLPSCCQRRGREELLLRLTCVDPVQYPMGGGPPCTIPRSFPSHGRTPRERPAPTATRPPGAVYPKAAIVCYTVDRIGNLQRPSGTRIALQSLPMTSPIPKCSFLSPPNQIPSDALQESIFIAPHPHDREAWLTSCAATRERTQGEGHANRDRP